MLHMDFSQRIVVDTQSLEWSHSPSSGVQRKPLAREDRESGHATSVVRYLAGANFSRHEHPGGEEILVLEGIFSDQTGNYGAGTYFRNPPGSSHSPYSQDGCVLFVKLCQFQPDDLQQICVNTANAEQVSGPDGLELVMLQQFGFEHTALVSWPQATVIEPQVFFGGAEFFVISGCLADQFGSYPAGHWLRYPHLSSSRLVVEGGTVAWVKIGHLISGTS